MQAVGIQKQEGYVLLLTLLAFMTIGGVVAASFTQDARKGVETSRYEHNQRVLSQAKRALLQYTYNYPQFNQEGPGRLPCPDFDNNGTPDPTIPNCAGVGRFPWADANMNFYDARDADGERLWYAVSNNFHNLGGGPNEVNSDMAGTITLYSQSGAVLYDGSVAGIAAVIIAPGEVITRDQDNDGVYEYTQVRGTVAQQLDSRNYLDTLSDTTAVAYDNRVFNNGVNNTNADGFIQGPVFDRTINTYVLNDQVAIVTAEEVIAMAEKSVIQTYRNAIRDYQQNAGVNRYPWLDPYDSGDGLNTFDAVVTAAAPTPVIGRLPSIFDEYFDPPYAPAPTQAIKPELRFSINIDGTIYNMSIPAPAAANTFFQANGDLVTQMNNGDVIQRFFWDGHKNGNEHVNSPADGIWEMCPLINPVAHEDDCNRTVAGTFIGVSEADTGTPETSDVWLEVRDVTITFSGGVPIVFADADRTATPIEYWQSSLENPDPQNHIYIAAEFDDNPSYISTFNWGEDEEFLNSYGIEPPGNIGAHTYDAGDSLKVGLPYYPVLPDWARTNGWHDMLQVAYSSAFQPGGDGVCNVGVDDCLTLLNSGGVTNNKIALLILSGIDGDDDATDTDLIDGGLGAAGAPAWESDDLGLIFDAENDDLDLVFDSRPNNVTDVVHLLE